MRLTLALVNLFVLSVVGCGRDGAAHESCRSRMTTIDGAIEMWAIEHSKTSNDVVQWTDLVGPDKYLPRRPDCPHGGFYSLTTVGMGPSCSIAEHTAAFRQR